MDVHIGTLTSRVTVTDGAAPGDEMVEKIVAMVLARLREEQAAQERLKEDQEIRPQMSEPARY